MTIATELDSYREKARAMTRAERKMELVLLEAKILAIRIVNLEEMEMEMEEEEEEEGGGGGGGGRGDGDGDGERLVSPEVSDKGKERVVSLGCPV